jgi:hypothetical protein
MITFNKHASIFTWTVAIALVMLAAIGCKSEEVKKFQEDCITPAAFDIAGDFDERYNCEERMQCVEEDVQFRFRIQRNVMDVDPSDGTDYVFSALEWAGSGTLCGMRFGWTASLPGSYNEAGFWDFSDNNTFVKESQYDYRSTTMSTAAASEPALGLEPVSAPVTPLRPRRSATARLERHRGV